MQSHAPSFTIWHTYRRLLGYSAAYWQIASLAIVGMIVDAACTTLFAKLIKPLLDRLFIDRDASTIFWMPLWIIGIFTVRGIASFLSDYGMASLALIILLATRPTLLTTMSPGTFFAVLMAMGGILPSLKRLTTVQSNIQRGMVAAEDLFAVLDMPTEEDLGSRTTTRVRGELQFKHVRFTYHGASSPALEDITLDCRPGTVTALVGRSGSGKSTLSSLVPRFHDPDAGSISLDGHDLRNYKLASLRQQMAWVGQSVVLFDGTVAHNIAYGELSGAGESAIIEAARAANALPFIERLPQGLHTPIGKDGEMLSGGERQRIAIARAILKNAPILVLDEATSALDTESEKLIQEALIRLTQNRTTLVIAHRLSTIQHADHIALIDRDRILEQGTHEALLAAQGQYAMLYRMQFA